MVNSWLIDYLLLFIINNLWPVYTVHLAVISVLMQYILHKVCYVMILKMSSFNLIIIWEATVLVLLNCSVLLCEVSYAVCYCNCLVIDNNWTLPLFSLKLKRQFYLKQKKHCFCCCCFFVILEQTKKAPQSTEASMGNKDQAKSLENLISFGASDEPRGCTPGAELQKPGRHHLPSPGKSTPLI